MPERPGQPGRTEPFRTKCELAVDLFREQARLIKGIHLAVFDGGFALGSVVRPLVLPQDGSPRIEFLTRLRHDARLYALPPKERELLNWLFFEGRDKDQICRDLEVDRDYLRVLLHRAKNHFRDRLAQQDSE